MFLVEGVEASALVRVPRPFVSVADELLVLP